MTCAPFIISCHLTKLITLHKRCTAVDSLLHYIGNIHGISIFPVVNRPFFVVKKAANLFMICCFPFSFLLTYCSPTVGGLQMIGLKILPAYRKRLINIRLENFGPATSLFERIFYPSVYLLIIFSASFFVMFPDHPQTSNTSCPF